MYKIFIDTNIYLDFYRANNKDNIKEVIKELKRYKKFVICTEQSDDEFLRNRERIITEFVSILNNQINSSYNNNFISTFSSYKSYYKDIKKANESINIMIDKCKELTVDVKKDPIYNLYSTFRSNMYFRTDRIVDKAFKRKCIGNPPTSNKTTCCDEIIWEILLDSVKDNLIIISRDNTFKENSNFLCNEFKKITGKDLVIFSCISDAIRKIGEIPSDSLEYLENNIIVESELKEYGMLKETSNWTNIIYNTLLALGGEADLTTLYSEVESIVKKKYPEKLSNNDMPATIRGILQRFSSDTLSYNRKNDLFKQVRRGRWSVRK